MGIFFIEELFHCFGIRVILIWHSGNLQGKEALFQLVNTLALLGSGLLIRKKFNVIGCLFLAGYLFSSIGISLLSLVKLFSLLVYTKTSIFQYDLVVRVANSLVILLEFYLEYHSEIFPVFFCVLNFELLYLSWMLINELSSISQDISEKKNTISIFLGRYETYRTFTLLQVLFYGLVLLDCINGEPKKWVLLLLTPWTCYFVFLIRNMKMKSFSSSYFVFSIVSACLLILLS